MAYKDSHSVMHAVAVTNLQHADTFEYLFVHFTYVYLTAEQING